MSILNRNSLLVICFLLGLPLLGCKRESKEDAEVQQGSSGTPDHKSCKPIYLATAPKESVHGYLDYIVKYTVLHKAPVESIVSAKVDLGPGKGDNWYQKLVKLNKEGDSVFKNTGLTFFLSGGEPYLLHGNHLAKLEGCGLGSNSGLYKKLKTVKSNLLTSYEADFSSKSFVLIGKVDDITLENSASKCKLKTQSNQPIRLRVKQLRHDRVIGYRTPAVIMTGVVQGKGLPPECSAFANKELTFSGANWYAALDWDN